MLTIRNGVYVIDRGFWELVWSCRYVRAHCSGFLALWVLGGPMFSTTSSWSNRLLGACRPRLVSGPDSSACQTHVLCKCGVSHHLCGACGLVRGCGVWRAVRVANDMGYVMHGDRGRGSSMIHATAHGT